MDESNVAEILKDAKDKEKKLMDIAVFLEFRQPMLTGMKTKRSSKKVAKLMGLPMERLGWVEWLLCYIKPKIKVDCV